MPDGSQFDIKRCAEIYEKPNASIIDIIFEISGEFKNLEKTLLIHTDIKKAAIKQTNEMTNHSLAVLNISKKKLNPDKRKRILFFKYLMLI